MEEKTPDEMEMAAQADEKRKKIKETAQGWVRIGKHLMYEFLELNF